MKDISAESVDEAIGHLHDVLANQADIDAAICAGQESVAAAAWPIPDENELERELEQLTCEQPGQTSATLGDELARLDEIQRELDALPSAPNETLAEQDTRAIDKKERIALTN